MAFMTIIDALSGPCAKNGWDKTCSDYLQFSRDKQMYLLVIIAIQKKFKLIIVVA